MSRVLPISPQHRDDLRPAARDRAEGQSAPSLKSGDVVVRRRTSGRRLERGAMDAKPVREPMQFV
jgi:hypothetical protein